MLAGLVLRDIDGDIEAEPVAGGDLVFELGIDVFECGPGLRADAGQRNDKRQEQREQQAKMECCFHAGCFGVAGATSCINFTTQRLRLRLGKQFEGHFAGVKNDVFVIPPDLMKHSDPVFPRVGVDPRKGIVRKGNRAR